MGTLARNPAARMREPEITTTESVIGGPPLPSIRTAPMIAFTLVSSLSLQPVREARRQSERRTRILILVQLFDQRLQSLGSIQVGEPLLFERRRQHSQQLRVFQRGA